MRVGGRWLAAVAAGAVLSLGVAGSAAAVTLEPVGTYSAPVFVTSDPSDPDRIFVVEQEGRIQLTAGGQTTTFLDLTTVDPAIVESGGDVGEQGLLSMAFAPGYAVSGRFYVFYTGTDAGTLHVDELTASGDAADPATRREVITIPHPTFDGHNGGQLQLGPDGYLYISTGDGGGGGDPGENAQDPDSLLGKILRIAPTPDGGYTNPPDNPFVGAAGADEVWSYGLRNPWRFSFDRQTGDLFVGDVGQASWEEIDFDPVSLGSGRADNFGWDCYEGRNDFETTGCPPLSSTTQPVLEYPNPGLAAVTGGYVVRDPGLTELQGRYVYADFFAGEIRSFVPAVPDAVDDRSENLMVGNLSSFGEDACGRVYVASLSGPVYRLVDDTPTDCSAQPTPSPEPSPIDAAGPVLTLDAKKKQSLEGNRTVSVTATADEAGTFELAGAVLARRRGRELFDLPTERGSVGPGGEKVTWKLRRKEARRARRLIGDERRVEVRFEGAVTDAAGNRGPDAALETRLVLD
jgi:glucose/arabinose dehydrogenase